MRMQKLYEALKSFHERLRAALDGKKVWKEELRKVGLVLIGLGLTGPLINGKAGMWPLLVVGIALETLGLMEDSDEEDDNV
ncbi:hypothetical protein DP44_5656 [Burkholderia pseudomallei]|uniref:hypothetical protein n=2 Tax=Burkholderia pseudomallei TaxID=28450 RepID=UPI00050ECD66|nr:hypothetical protein [Burkholderia pseudomallei]KGD42886.1 hypothetical protein DP44_5656 [Burkholderia pseudomallei]